MRCHLWRRRKHCGDRVACKPPHTSHLTRLYSGSRSGTCGSWAAGLFCSHWRCWLPWHSTPQPAAPTCCWQTHRSRPLLWASATSTSRQWQRQVLAAAVLCMRQWGLSNVQQNGAGALKSSCPPSPTQPHAAALSPPACAARPALHFHPGSCASWHGNDVHAARGLPAQRLPWRGQQAWVSASGIQGGCG